MKKTISQGVMYLGISQIVFVIVGYIVNIVLGRLLGPIGYGIYGVVMAVNTAFVMTLLAGVPGAVTKYVSEEKVDAKVIRKKGLVLQTCFSTLLFIVYLLASKYIAIILRDPTLEKYLYVSALVIPLISVYAIYVSYFNGTRQYGKQTRLGITYALSKAVFILVLVAMGFSLWGAIWGIVLANLAASIACIFIHDKYKSQKGTKEDIEYKELVNFAYPLILSAFVIALLPHIDLLFIKYFLSATETGIYNAAATIARAPMFVLAALSMALFPAISHSIANNKPDDTKRYIFEALRYLIMILLPFFAIIAATKTNLILLLYSDQYVMAASVIAILIFGKVLAQFTAIFITVINASGFTKFKLFVSIISIGIISWANLTLIPLLGMRGAAFAMCTEAAIMVIISGTYVFTKFKPKFPWKSFVRIGLISIGIFFAASFLDISRYWIPLLYAGMAGVYALALVGTKEITKQDFLRFKGVVPEKVLKFIPTEVERFFD